MKVPCFPISATSKDFPPSLFWGYISRNHVNIPLFQSNVAYLNSVGLLCCSILENSLLDFSLESSLLHFRKGTFPPPATKRKAGGALAPPAPLSSVPDKKCIDYFFGIFLTIYQYHVDAGGYSLLFYTEGVRIDIWGLRFYKKITFGVCELQLKKNSMFRV